MYTAQSPIELYMLFIIHISYADIIETKQRIQIKLWIIFGIAEKEHRTPTSGSIFNTRDLQFHMQLKYEMTCVRFMNYLWDTCVLRVLQSQKNDQNIVVVFHLPFIFVSNEKKIRKTLILIQTHSTICFGNAEMDWAELKFIIIGHYNLHVCWSSANVGVPNAHSYLWMRDIYVCMNTEQVEWP